MVEAGLEDRTRASYNNLLNDFYLFCEFYGHDPLVMSVRVAQEYIVYLFYFTDHKHGAADRRITALGHYWKRHGYNWDRRSNPSLAAMFKGYRKRKPSARRIRYPFTFFHMEKAFENINLKTYTGLLIASGLCIGYFFGGRIGEYSPRSRNDWHQVLLRKDLQFVGPKKRYTALIIDFKTHKTNKYGLYCGKVECICSCETGICPVHILDKFVRLRDKEFGREDAWSDPLLLKLNNYPLAQYAINNMIKNFIIEMGLNPKFYSSHSLRSGRATDLARALRPAWFIKKWGRWRSNCWEDFYAKLDMSDIAKLSNLSWHELGISKNSLISTPRKLK